VLRAASGPAVGRCSGKRVVALPPGAVIFLGDATLKKQAIEVRAATADGRGPHIRRFV
jgi:hypothetical protein